MSKQELKQKGFTIIEVVLVLAIAALIFLMVFIALPALQRSQRDTARKNDVSIVASAVSSWQGNNRSSASKWPSGTQILQYATNKSDNTTTVTADDGTAAVGTVSVTDGTITVYPGKVCGEVSPGKVEIKKGTTRNYATITYLESGNGSGYCLDS